MAPTPTSQEVHGEAARTRLELAYQQTRRRRTAARLVSPLGWVGVGGAGGVLAATWTGERSVHGGDGYVVVRWRI